MAWKEPTPTSEYQEKSALLFRANMKRFVDYLQSAGCALKPLSSKYEVLRYTAHGDKPFPGKKPATHVIYRKGDGRISFVGDSFMHFNMFIAGRPMFDQHAVEPPKPKRRRKGKGLSPEHEAVRYSWTKRMREHLLERDGPLCWFCHQSMYRTDDTYDITIEHLLARSLAIDQGMTPKQYNDPKNLVLAHAKCNRDAGHRTLEEKQITRQLYKDGLRTSVAHWHDVPSPPPRTRKR